MSVMESKIMEPMMELEKTEPKMDSYTLVLLNQFRGATDELIGCLNHIANVSADPNESKKCYLGWLLFEKYYCDSTYPLGNQILLAIAALEDDRALLTSFLIKLKREKSSLKNHDGLNFFQQRVSQLLNEQRVLSEFLQRQLGVVEMQLVGSPYHYISPPNSEYDSDESSKQTQEEMYVAPLNSESNSYGSSKQTQEEMYVAPLNSKSNSYGSSKQTRKQIRPLNLTKKKKKYKLYSKEYLAQAVNELMMGKSMKLVLEDYPVIPSRTLYDKWKRAREQAIKQL